MQNLRQFRSPKRYLSLLLTLALLLGMVPAYAAETDGSPSSEDEGASASHGYYDFNKVADEEPSEDPDTGYRIKQQDDDVFSLSVGEKTFYFDSFQAVLEASNDTKIAGDMTLKVLASNSTESPYVYDSSTKSYLKVFDAASSMTIDLNGQTLAIKGVTTHANNTSYLYFSKIPTQIIDSSYNGNGIDDIHGFLYIDSGALSGMVTRIENIHLQTENGTSYAVSSKADMTIDNCILERNSVAASVAATTNVCVVSCSQTAVVSDSVIINTVERDTASAFSSSGDSFTVKNCSVSVPNGAVIASKSFYATFTIDGGTYQTKEFVNIPDDSCVFTVTIEDGVFEGPLINAGTRSSFTINGGYFSENFVTNSTGLPPRIKPVASTDDGHTDYYQYVPFTTVNAYTSLDGLTGAATLECDSVAYETEDYVCTITLLANMQVSQILLNGVAQELTSDENGYGYSVSTDGLTVTYRIPEQSKDFTLVFTISEDSNLTETVASVGGAPYKSLSGALGAVTENNNVVTLEQDVTYPTNLILNNKDVTLDLNGKTLTVQADGSATGGIQLNGGSLTVRDGSEAQTGAISFASSTLVGIYLTGDGTAFTLESGTLRGIDYTSGTDSMMVWAGATNQTITIAGGHIIGMVLENSKSAASRVTVSGGLIEAYGSNADALYLKGYSSTTMTGGEVRSETGTGIYGYGAILIAGDPGTIDISGGTIRAAGTVTDDEAFAAVYIYPDVIVGTYNIGGTAELISADGPALYVSGSLRTDMAMVVNIEDGAKLRGGTNAVQINDTSNRTNMPTINVQGGSFACGADYLPISDTYYVTYPTNYVLNTAADGDGYYTLATKESLRGTNPETEAKYEYQDYAGNYPGGGLGGGLDDILAEAKAIYDTDNAAGYPANDLWTPFVEAYNAAVRVRYVEGDASTNPNANQMEINYRAKALTLALQALENYNPDLNPKSLADGTYSIKVTGYKFDMSGTSMANGAFDPNATLTVENGVAKLSINVHPIYMMGTWGRLLHLWTFAGDTPEESKGNWNAYSNSLSGTAADKRVEAEYSNWYAHTGEASQTDAITTAVEAGLADKQTDVYQYPGTFTITLPDYRDTTLEGSTLYARVDVDAMAFGSTAEGAGHANLLIVLSWGTLKEIETHATLSVDTTPMILLPNGTQSVTASVLGGAGYTLSVSSSNTGVATAAIDETTGAITVKAVAAGEASITVTASNGEDTKTAVIPVTVVGAVQQYTAVDVAGVTVEGSATTATLSGNVLVTSGANDVSVSGGTVTVNATSTESADITTAQVVIPTQVAQALAGKTTTIQTDVGSVKVDSALMTQIAAANGAVTLTVAAADPANTGATGTFTAAYELTLTDSTGAAVDFGGGSAVVTVPGSADVKYAYYIKDGVKAERQSVIPGDGTVSWTTSHFSLWALSANEYTTGSSGEGTNPGNQGGVVVPEDGYFLKDGNYYVNIALYKESNNEESMGNVAFTNNNKALVTVKDGAITTVQVATNPVDVSASNVTYHSGITDVKISGAKVNVLETGALTTKPAENDYDYVKLFSFSMPSSGQPEYGDEITFVDVQFIVPDTPMDEVVGAGSNAYLQARLRFDWSTAAKTSASDLESNDSTAKGTSSLSGESVTDVELTDKSTGILLSTNTEGLSDEAVLSVTKPASGSDYDTAVKAMSGVKDDWTLYKIVATVNGKETAPEGSVTLSIPCTSAGLTVYRINDGGTKTTIRGSVKDGYYVFSTSSLGLFAVVGEVVETQILVDVTDRATGIRLTSAEQVLPSSAVLKVTEVTSGADYTAAETALAEKAAKFAVYTIAAQTSSGRDTAPTGAFTLSFPIPTDYATKRMAVYRLENGRLTELTGAVSATGKAYTVETDALGTFVVAEKIASVLDDFTDLNGHWAKAYIEAAVERGLFSGTSETTFSPDAAMTRGMFVTVLGRLAGVEPADGQTKFADVPAGAYYAPFVAWANENGIVTGTSAAAFAPDQAITRQEMALILLQYAKYAGITLKDGESIAFTDADAIDAWAADAVDTVVKAGLLVGTGDGQFSPKTTATRAQVATLLVGFIRDYSL